MSDELHLRLSMIAIKLLDDLQDAAPSGNTAQALQLIHDALADAIRVSVVIREKAIRQVTAHASR